MFLTTSANRIAENDLDFSIVYDRNDEMGLLCKAFEKMRSALELSLIHILKHECGEAADAAAKPESQCPCKTGVLQLR